MNKLDIYSFRPIHIAVILAACFSLLFSCKSADNPKPADVIPTFTCSDHSEEGKFETWNDAEWARVAQAHYEYPDHEMSGSISWVGITSYQMSLSDTAKQFFLAVKDENTTFNYDFSNQDNTKGASTGFGVPSLKVNDTFKYWIRPAFWQCTPGCYRYYYAFADTNKVVVTKGHFDIEIIP